MFVGIFVVSTQLHWNITITWCKSKIVEDWTNFWTWVGETSVLSSPKKSIISAISRLLLTQATLAAPVANCVAGMQVLITAVSKVDDVVTVTRVELVCQNISDMQDSLIRPFLRAVKKFQYLINARCVCRRRSKEKTISGFWPRVSCDLASSSIFYILTAKSKVNFYNQNVQVRRDCGRNYLIEI